MVGLIEFGTTLILDWISQYGYWGIILLMALESATLPVPSEIVMPFAGFLVWEQGVMNLPGVILAGTIGCTLGSIAAYAVGYYAGRPVILRYGKYVLLSERHLVQAERWFARYGGKATFIARLLPIIRTVISLPAGISKMRFKPFVLYSFVGSLPWTAMLAYVGFWLGPNWEDIGSVFRGMDILVVVGAVALIIWYVHAVRKRNSKSDEPQA
jgi:membrane protein DedA with SNARE-associated domain